MPDMDATLITAELARIATARMKADLLRLEQGNLLERAMPRLQEAVAGRLARRHRTGLLRLFDRLALVQRELEDIGQ